MAPGKMLGKTLHLTAGRVRTYRRLIDHYIETRKPIPDNALIFSADGSQAYVTKRFDRHADGRKRAQDDFASLASYSNEW